MKKIVILVITLLLLMTNNEIQATNLCNEILVQDSFVIESNGFITFNFTILESHDIYYEQEVNIPIQSFIVNESNFNLFNQKETFYDVFNTAVYFSNNEPNYFPLGDFSIYSRIQHTGDLILLLNNIETVTVEGSIFVEKIVHATQTTSEDSAATTEVNTSNQIFITDVHISTPLTPLTGETTNKTTDVVVTPLAVILVSILLFVRKKRKSQ